MRSIVARLRAEVRAQGGGGVRVKCAERDMHEKGRVGACREGDPLRPPSTVFRGTKGSRVSEREVPRSVSYPLVVHPVPLTMQ